MGTFDSYGLSEKEVRDLIEREFARAAASTSFHWESDELEDLMDVLTDVLAKVIAANNRAMSEAIKSRGLQDMRVPPGLR